MVYTWEHTSTQWYIHAAGPSLHSEGPTLWQWLLQWTMDRSISHQFSSPLEMNYCHWSKAKILGFKIFVHLKHTKDSLKAYITYTDLGLSYSLWCDVVTVWYQGPREKVSAIGPALAKDSPALRYVLSLPENSVGGCSRYKRATRSRQWVNNADIGRLTVAGTHHSLHVHHSGIARHKRIPYLHNTRIAQSCFYWTITDSEWLTVITYHKTLDRSPRLLLLQVHLTPRAYWYFTVCWKESDYCRLLYILHIPVSSLSLSHSRSGGCVTDPVRSR